MLIGGSPKRKGARSNRAGRANHKTENLDFSKLSVFLHYKQKIEIFKYLENHLLAKVNLANK